MQIVQPLTVSYDDLYQAFTHSQLLAGIEAISVDPGIDRTITAQCFLALSTTYFGIKHHEKAVTTRGLSRYETALRRVHDALADENSLRSFDMLEAVMIMEVTEVRLLVKRLVLELTNIVFDLRTRKRLDKPRTRT